METRKNYNHNNDNFALAMGISEKRDDFLMLKLSEIFRRSVGDVICNEQPITEATEGIEEIVDFCSNPREVAMCSYLYALSLKEVGAFEDESD